LSIKSSAFELLGSSHILSSRSFDILEIVMHRLDYLKKGWVLIPIPQDWTVVCFLTGINLSMKDSC